MRIVLILLLSANLGFWAWVNWIKAAPAPAVSYDGPGITLLRELPEDSPLRQPPESSAAAPSSAAADQPGGNEADGPASPAPVVRAGCVTIGPFVDAQAADAAAAILLRDRIETESFATEDEIWDGYWVYIEQIASRDQARAMLDELNENGIDDAYMIPNSDSGILISLGVFSEISGAGVLAERVGNLGFEATIADRMREAETIRLRLELRDDIDVLAMLQEPGRINRLEQRACAAAPD